MSKINSAIHEIHHIDRLASRDQWVNQVHPLVKLVLTIVYLVCVLSFPKYDFLGLLSMVVYPLAGYLLADLSFRESLWRLRVVLPLVCVVGLANPFFDRIPVQLGPLTINTGVISMLTLMLKGIFAVLASYLLIATTTIERLCYALRLLHLPKIMVTQLMLTYRYVSLLLEEAGRITQAYSLRAPRQKGVHFKVWGSLTGQLLLRSIDRANEVYESMALRGYRGEFLCVGEKLLLRRTDVLYFVIWTALFALLRRFPLIILVGNLIGGFV